MPAGHGHDAAARLEQASRSVSESLGAATATTSELSEVLGDVTAQVRRVASRLAEVAEVAQRLEDLAARVAVTALDVGVEACRGDAAVGEPLAAMSDEVRRLAERTGVATRRLTELVLEMDELSTSAEAGLARAGSRSERLGQALREAADRADRLELDASELSASLADRAVLPDGEK
jgi:methyl-accepting chemotaxis protein